MIGRPKPKRYLVVENGNPVHTPAWIVGEDGNVVRSVGRDEAAALKASGVFCDGFKVAKPPVETYYGHVAWELGATPAPAPEPGP